jgi:hypothetical protein
LKLIPTKNLSKDLSNNSSILIPSFALVSIYGKLCSSANLLASSFFITLLSFKSILFPTKNFKTFSLAYFSICLSHSVTCKKLFCSVKSKTIIIAFAPL